jgi:hypothetical protein
MLMVLNQLFESRKGALHCIMVNIYTCCHIRVQKNRSITILTLDVYHEKAEVP